jgi:hypothetical protein
VEAGALTVQIRQILLCQVNACLDNGRHQGCPCVRGSSLNTTAINTLSKLAAIARVAAPSASNPVTKALEKDVR